MLATTVLLAGLRGVRGQRGAATLPKDVTPAASPPGTLAERAPDDSQLSLKVADALRREGEVLGAIRAYSAVIQMPGARSSEVQSARAWRARLCLERGESSALDELVELAKGHLPLHLYAHVALTILRAGGQHDDSDSAAKRATVLAAVTDQLERASRVLGASGERAQRWLERVRAQQDRAR